MKVGEVSGRKRSPSSIRLVAVEKKCSMVNGMLKHWQWKMNMMKRFKLCRDRSQYAHKASDESLAIA
jgi:hypothetical protein